MNAPIGEAAAKLYNEVHGTNVAEFRTAALEAAELANTIAILQEDFKAKKAALMPYMKKAGVGSVRVLQDEEDQDSYVRVTLTKGRKGSRKVSIEKLQKLQVPEATILAAITQGEDGEPSIKISTKVTGEEAE